MKDSVHVQLRKAIEHGFPKGLDKELKDYSAVKHELVIKSKLSFEVRRTSVSH